MIEDFEYEDSLVIVSEYAEEGTLAKWLDDRDPHSHTIQQAINLITGLLSGIEHLHAHDIAHLDIKPSNILLKNGQAIICDFGMAINAGTGRKISSASIGTPPYAAPEGTYGGYSFQSDIWSAGILFYQILIGIKYCSPESSAEFLASLLKRPDWLSLIPPHWKEIVETSVHKDPSKRYPSAITMRNAIHQAARSEQTRRDRRADSMPYSATISRKNPSSFVCLIDQSLSMNDPIRGGKGKRKCDAAADAINKVLQDLTIKCAKSEGTRHYFDIAVIGYGEQVKSAFGGSLAGKDFVSVTELATSHLRIETREKEMPDGAGGIMKQTVKFPVWFAPVAANGTPMAEALSLAYGILEDWINQHKDSYPPVVINITDGEANEDPTAAAEKVKSLSTSDGNVLLFNCHIAETADATSIMFPMLPDDEDILPNEFARMLCHISSIFPEKIRRIAREIGIRSIGEQARGFVYNADLVDLVRFLQIGTPVSHHDLR